MSVENPAVPLSTLADGDTYDALTGGTETATGIKVTRTKALGVSALWRAVNLISNDVGRHAFRVYMYDGAGLVADPEHRAAKVMRRPNEMMTPFTFRQVVQAHALTEGNGYSYIYRDPVTAFPLALWPLDPNRTWPVRANGTLWYVFEYDEPIPGRRRNKRGMVKIPSADMIHIKGLGFDGLTGYPVTRILRETIGGAIAARDYGSRFFRNNARPGLALEVPVSMKPEAVNNLRESWEKLHTGLTNAHRVAILRDGVKLVTYDTSAKNAQLLENREFDAREIANVIGVPPHKLGDPSKTAYNSLESENNGYREDTLDSWFVAWEQECDAKLLTEEEKVAESHCCKFDARPLSRLNATDRATFYNQGINGGWLNQDEVRGYENLNPLPSGQGKLYYRPVNLAPITADQPTTNPAPVPSAQPAAASESADAVRAAVCDIGRETTERMIRRLITQAERLAKRPAELRTWLLRNDGMAGENNSVIADAVRPVVVAIRAAGGQCDDPEAFAAKLTDEFAQAIIPAIGAVSDLAASIRNVAKTIPVNTRWEY